MDHFYILRKRDKENHKTFKEAQIKVEFQTKNTIQNIVKPCPQLDKYEESGIYQMRCIDYPLKYIGQMGRTFQTRYKNTYR
jgi:hypothetical protein